MSGMPDKTRQSDQLRRRLNHDTVLLLLGQAKCSKIANLFREPYFSRPKRLYGQSSQVLLSLVISSHPPSGTHLETEDLLFLSPTTDYTKLSKSPHHFLIATHGADLYNHGPRSPSASIRRAAIRRRLLLLPSSASTSYAGLSCGFRCSGSTVRHVSAKRRHCSGTTLCSRYC